MTTEQFSGGYHDMVKQVAEIIGDADIVEGCLFPTVAGDLQCPACPSVSLDLHGRAVGAGDAVQPDAPPAAERTGGFRCPTSSV